MLPIVVKGFLEVIELSDFRKPQAKVVIFSAVKLGIDATYAIV
jgi:hypothetical protein